MNRVAITAATLVMAASLKAAEHPEEHPAGAPASSQQQQPAQAPQAMPQAQPAAKEHPEHPSGKPAQAPEGSKAWLNQIRKEYDAKVCEVGKGKSKTEAYRIHDDKLGKDWDLRVVKVHKDRIVQLGKNQFFACSDFKSVKIGEKDKLDLDFFATKNPDGSWTIDKALIHKVNGVPRYTWNEKNEMVPANN